ncbi:MAG: TetR/AcrR family transcriptional regulator [Erysipelotrichaceae bacterium]
MPKIYSEKQKEEIKQKLKYEANILMKEKGVKKTTVDELVKRVNIPKGTFYLFYSSKEELLFEVSQDYQKKIDETINAKLYSLLKKDKPENHIEEITQILMEALDITCNSCLKQLLNPESMNLILAKLPQSVLNKHLEEQPELLNYLNTDLNPETIKGAFMMIIFGGMYKKETGEENWEDSIKLLIRGLVLQLIKQNDNL